jgi:hypothetical protein
MERTRGWKKRLPDFSAAFLGPAEAPARTLCWRRFRPGEPGFPRHELTGPRVRTWQRPRPIGCGSSSSAAAGDPSQSFGKTLGKFSERGFSSGDDEFQAAKLGPILSIKKSFPVETEPKLCNKKNFQEHDSS